MTKTFSFPFACVLTLAGCSTIADRTCTLNPNSVVLRNPDSTVFVSPLFTQSEVDTMGIYLGWIQLLPEVVVPEHVHMVSDEIVFVTCGAAQATVAGEEMEMGRSSSLRIRRNQLHGVRAGPTGLVAVHVYKPRDGGRRFYDWEEVPVGR